jgi:ketosteroid isomerase-like protein
MEVDFMTSQSLPGRIEPSELPEVITAYLTAHRSHDTEAAIESYAGDAVVVDDGHSYRGVDEIRGWLSRSSTEYEYTIELTSAQMIDDEHWIASHHLSGNFPGGEVDLDYRFTLQNGRIGELVVEPT